MDWYWCETCNCACIKCERCKNTSCNGGGCDFCHDTFEEASKLSGSMSKEGLPVLKSIFTNFPCRFDNL